MESLESKEDSAENDEIGEPLKAFAASLILAQKKDERPKEKNVDSPRSLTRNFSPNQRELQIFQGGVSSSFDLIKDHVTTLLKENREEIQKEVDNAEPMYIPKKDRRIIPPIPNIYLLQVGTLGLYDNYRRPKPQSLIPPSQFYDDLYEFEPQDDLKHNP